MKKLLMLSVVLFGAGSVAATNVTHPFYGPEAGKFLSDSSLTYENIRMGGGRFILMGNRHPEAAILSETLTYGITSDWSASVKVADTYAFNWGATGHEKYDNPAWGVSTKYNILNDAWKVQAEAGYNQGFAHGTFMGFDVPTFTYSGDHHAKDIYGTVKAGYEAGDGFVPYASLTVSQNIGADNTDPSFITRVAAYKDLGNSFTVDGGLSYQWDSAKAWGWKHFRAWVADAGVNYLFCDNMSVGVKGSYLIKTNVDNLGWPVDDAYTLGVNFKVAF